MNHNFTTPKAHIELPGGTVLELYTDEALNTQSTTPFRGNIDVQKLKDAIREYGTERIAFVRMEATTNLIGGQPFAIENLPEGRKITKAHGIPLVFDGSLISENAYFIKMRDKNFADKSVGDIIHEMMGMGDLFYLSGP